MATITTKYAIGDTVYLASTETERKQHPCPDCLGSKSWAAISPAGTEYRFPCPRCTASYMAERDVSLVYTAHVPFVRRLTIGSVQYNSAAGSWDSGARYMCNETGVGSGTVYEETRLFEIEEDARAQAQLIADTENRESEWIVKLYDKTLKVSDYQLDSAMMEEARKERSRAGSLLWNLSDLFGRIEECSDKDEILEAIDDYKKYEWKSDAKAAQGTEAGTGETEGLGPKGESAIRDSGDAQ